MSYIGRGTDSISNVEVLDNLTFDGSASYTLQKSSVNFVPSSANNLLISISGVVQQGNFSVSGSTITFNTNVSASDTCDWILHYGTGLITTVADGAITEAKLGNNAVTASKIDSSVALGKIGQVVQATTSSTSTITTTTFTDTNLSGTITPTATSSKVLVTVSQPFYIYRTSANVEAWFRILRDATSVWESTARVYGYNLGSTATSQQIYYIFNYSYLDSPSSTSAITYKTQARVTSASNSAEVRTNDQPSSIILSEVLA